MIRIGLTGNIGTGKSTAARIFEILGVPVYHADKQAKEILASEAITREIVKQFGTQVINSQQQIDRKMLASVVFYNSEKLSALNSLIHPLVEKDFEAWCERHADRKYIIQEAAILFESGFNRLFDATILVTAPEELCISRVMARDGMTREMVTGRIQNQWTQEKKLQLADYKVKNDEITPVIPQVLLIHHKILES